jgi:hypothetical protein
VHGRTASEDRAVEMIRIPDSMGGGPPHPGVSPERVQELVGLLAEELGRTRYVGRMGWGFVLFGEPTCAVGYGHLYIVTPAQVAVPLTQTMVKATQGRGLFLFGSTKTTLTVSPICQGMGPEEPLPTVDVLCAIGCAQPVRGGSRFEATVGTRQAHRTPLHLLTREPIPGWPR